MFKEAGFASKAAKHVHVNCALKCLEIAATNILEDPEIHDSLVEGTKRLGDLGNQPGSLMKIPDDFPNLQVKEKHQPCYRWIKSS